MYEDRPKSDKKKILQSTLSVGIALVIMLTVVFIGYDGLINSYLDLEFLVIATISILFSVFIATMGFKNLLPTTYIITNKGVEINSSFKQFNVPYEIIEDVTIESEGPSTYHHLIGHIIMDLTSKSGKCIVIKTPAADFYLSPTNPSEFKKEIEKCWKPSEIVDYVPTRPITMVDNIRSSFLYTFLKVPFGELLLWIPISFILISYNLTLYQTHIVVTLLIVASYILIYFYSDRLVAMLTDSTPISDSNIIDATENLARKANISVPKVDVANSLLKGMNSLVSGPYPSRSKIILTQEILKLPEDQRTAVLAHEIAHVKNKDVLFSFIVGVFVFLTWSYMWFIEVVPRSGGLLVLFGYFLFFSFIFGFVQRAVEMRADFDSLSFHDLPKAFESALNSLGENIAKQSNSLLLVFGHAGKAKSIDNVKSMIGLERPAKKMKRLWLWLQSHPPIYYRLENVPAVQKYEGFLKIFSKTTRAFFRELIS